MATRRDLVAVMLLIAATGGIFHLWGHSWELDQHGDWDRLERVLAHIAHHPEVSYVENGALAKVVSAP